MFKLTIPAIKIDEVQFPEFVLQSGLTYFLIPPVSISEEFSGLFLDRLRPSLPEEIQAGLFDDWRKAKSPVRFFFRRGNMLGKLTRYLGDENLARELLAQSDMTPAEDFLRLGGTPRKLLALRACAELNAIAIGDSSNLDPMGSLRLMALAALQAARDKAVILLESPITRNFGEIAIRHPDGRAAIFMDKWVDHETVGATIRRAVKVYGELERS